MASSIDKKESSSNHHHHVLIVSFSPPGHINPSLRFAKRLHSKSLHVALATTEIAHHRLLTSSTVSDIPLLCFSDGFDLDYNRGANVDHYMETLGKMGPINLSNLIQQYYHSKGIKLSCVISNPFLPWVVDVATEHNIPCSMLWIQPCSLFAIYFRFFNKLNPFGTSQTPDSTVELPGLPILNKSDLPSFITTSNQLDIFTKILSELFSNMKKYKWVLANSILEIEKEAIQSLSKISPILPIGPLVPPSLLGQDKNLDIEIQQWKPDDTCLNWLDKQADSSVIYVSFGSMVVLSGKETEAIAKALKKSKRPFLWVVKRPDSDTEVLNEIGEQGIVVSWCPQTEVLCHKAVACFITHCGWNSLSESIASGVPVIAYPKWTDQPTNAKLVCDVFKIGVRMRVGEDGVLDSEEVGRCVGEMLDGLKYGEWKSNAVRLKVAAEEAAACGGSSDRNIQFFVDEIAGN